MGGSLCLLSPPTVPPLVSCPLTSSGTGLQPDAVREQNLFFVPRDVCAPERGANWRGCAGGRDGGGDDRRLQAGPRPGSPPLQGDLAGAHLVRLPPWSVSPAARAEQGQPCRSVRALVEL